MIGVKKIPKNQLQDGLVDLIQVTPVTLTTGGWSLVSGFYEYNYSNANIESTSVIDIIPENASAGVFKLAGILPSTLNSLGSIKIYATNLPSSNMTVTINIIN